MSTLNICLELRYSQLQLWDFIYDLVIKTDSGHLLKCQTSDAGMFLSSQTVEPSSDVIALLSYQIDF